jgi:hypothetical protein
MRAEAGPAEHRQPEVRDETTRLPFSQEFHFGIRHGPTLYTQTIPLAPSLSLSGSDGPWKGRVPALPGTGKPESALFCSEFSDNGPSLPDFNLFAWHRPLSSWQRQRGDPPHHTSEQPPRRMALCQQQPG